MKIYSKIRYFIFLIEFILTVAVVLILFAFSNSQSFLWTIRKKWAKIQAKILNYQIIQIGEFKEEAQMLIINHQSMLDIIALEDIYPKNLCWIAKKELSEIPLFKIAMKKPQFLCIDRKNPRELIRILKEAKQRVQENRILAIFPEGTRSRAEKLLKFQSGAKILGEKLNLKIQPILIVDSAKILDSKNFRANGGKLKIICMDLVDFNNESWLENTRKKMQELLDNERKTCSTPY